MALTPEIRSSQSETRVAENSTPPVQISQAQIRTAENGSPPVQASQIGVLTAFNFPSDGMQVSAAPTLVMANLGNEIEVSQTGVLVAVLGRPQFRRSRAWGFSLDAHEFYVLRIGEVETLTLDITTKQWALWSTNGRDTWRAHLGQNWLGVAKANFLNGNARTNVVAGDDTTGVIWTLDPERGVDDAPNGIDTQSYERIVTAGIPMRLQASPRHSSMTVTFTTGTPDPEASAEIRLRISDDNGNTFWNAETKTVVAGQFRQPLTWRSLGVIRAPGRLMEFRDRGATPALFSLNARIGSDDTESGQ